MKNEFKFGDRVHHQKYGECFVIDQWFDSETNEPTWVNIISERYGAYEVGVDELELIPHSDTARLDYIINNTSAFQKRNIVGNRYQQTMPSDFRQAIDEAMKNAARLGCCQSSRSEKIKEKQRESR